MPLFLLCEAFDCLQMFYTLTENDQGEWIRDRGVFYFLQCSRSGVNAIFTPEGTTEKIPVLICLTEIGEPA